MCLTSYYSEFPFVRDLAGSRESGSVYMRVCFWIVRNLSQKKRNPALAIFGLGEGSRVLLCRGAGLLPDGCGWRWTDSTPSVQRIEGCGMGLNLGQIRPSG